MPEADARLQRIEKIDPAYTIRGMFFSSALDVVRKAIDESAVKDVLTKAGLASGDFGTLKKYPMKDFLKLQLLAAQRVQHLFGSLEEAIAKMGGSACETFFESVAGKTMKLLAGRDPHRLISAAPNGYTLAVGDQSSRVYTRIGDKACTFKSTNDSVGPVHNLGVFQAALKGACEVNAVIDIQQFDLFNYTFTVTW